MVEPMLLKFKYAVFAGLLGSVVVFFLDEGNYLFVLVVQTWILLYWACTWLPLKLKKLGITGKKFHP